MNLQLIHASNRYRHYHKDRHYPLSCTFPNADLIEDCAVADVNLSVSGFIDNA